MDWNEMIKQARALPDGDIARHASVSRNNRHSCRDCFTCACMYVQTMRREQPQLVNHDGKTGERNTHDVVILNRHVGQVIPVTNTEGDLWEALDDAGHRHGDHWLTAWYAAEAMARGMRECGCI